MINNYTLTNFNNLSSAFGNVSLAREDLVRARHSSKSSHLNINFYYYEYRNLSQNYTFNFFCKELSDSGFQMVSSSHVRRSSSPLHPINPSIEIKSNAYGDLIFCPTVLARQASIIQKEHRTDRFNNLNRRVILQLLGRQDLTSALPHGVDCRERTGGRLARHFASLTVVAPKLNSIHFHYPPKIS